MTSIRRFTPKFDQHQPGLVTGYADALKPTWQTEDGSVRLFLGDCLDVLPGLSGVDAVVTDPPYGIRYDARGGIRLAPRQSYDIPKVDGDDEEFDPSHLLKIGRRQMIWGADHFRTRLPDRGRFLVWHKRVVREPESAERLDMADAEMCWDSGGSLVRVFRHVQEGFIHDGYGDNCGRVHPTQKPVAVMVWCLLLASDSKTILDPFMGSGTTGVACVRTGRKFIGIEKEEKYFETAVKRITDELNRAPLFEPKPQVQRELLP